MEPPFLDIIIFTYNYYLCDDSVYFNRSPLLAEKELIEQIHSGNTFVFKEIFDKYYLPLRSFAYRYVENDDVTDDFVQDAFLTVWERRHDFPVLAAIKSFLYTTVKNSCLNYLKRQQVKIRNEGQLARWLEADNEGQMIFEEEIHARIYRAIKDLSPQARQVILYSMEGLSNPEISEKMDLSLNTVKTVKLRAYRILRKKLSGLSWLFFIFS